MKCKRCNLEIKFDMPNKYIIDVEKTTGIELNLFKTNGIEINLFDNYEKHLLSIYDGNCESCYYILNPIQKPVVETLTKEQEEAEIERDRIAKSYKYELGCKKCRDINFDDMGGGK